MKGRYNGMMAKCLIVVISLIIPGTSLAAGQCPAIKCDCKFLPAASWVEACTDYEKHIKNECVANYNTPKDYCLLHGINAEPIALALHVNKNGAAKRASQSPGEIVDGYKRTVDSALAVVDVSLQNAEYSQVMDTLKLIEDATRKQFKMQQSLLWDDTNQIKNFWKMHVSAEEGIAKKFSKLAERLDSEYQAAANDRNRKVFRVLLVKALRINGLMFEHAAFANAWLDKISGAAENWVNAYETSVKLIDLANDSGSSETDNRFDEIQAAARIQQASIYLMKDNDLKSVNARLNMSSALLGEKNKLDVSKIIKENNKAMKKEKKKVNTTLECISGKKPHLCK